jgi:hypothetical protein
MKITFTTKETYLQWTSEWKAQYQALSNDIRDAKYARWYADSARTPNGLKRLSAAQDARYDAIAKRLPDRWGMFFANAALRRLRAEATALLELRKAAKIEAQRQYLAAHVPVVQV